MAEPLYTLWFRPDRSHPWVAVFAGPTSQACVDAMADDRTHHHGDWTTTAGTQRPTNVNLCIPRRTKA